MQNGKKYDVAAGLEGVPIKLMDGLRFDGQSWRAYGVRPLPSGYRYQPWSPNVWNETHDGDANVVEVYRVTDRYGTHHDVSNVGHGSGSLISHEPTNPRLAPSDDEKICEGCNRSFRPHRVGLRFCSRDCQKRAARRLPSHDASRCSEGRVFPYL